PTPERTHLLQFVVIMGSFMAVLVAYLGYQLWGLRARLGHGALLGLGATMASSSSLLAADATTMRGARMPASPALTAERWAGSLALVAPAVAILLILAGSPVVGVSIFMLSAIAVVVLLRRVSAGTAFLLLLAATALAIIGGVEVVTLKGDLGRMNTVFKFYLQAWLFLSIACGAMLALLARRVYGSPWLTRKRRGVLLGMAIILAIPFLYTIYGTPVKVGARFESLPPTLDGMAYMSQAKYSDEKGDMHVPDDFVAINWMLDNIHGSPVI